MYGVIHGTPSPSFFGPTSLLSLVYEGKVFADSCCSAVVIKIEVNKDRGLPYLDNMVVHWTVRSTFDQGLQFYSNLFAGEEQHEVPIRARDRSLTLDLHLNEGFNSLG